MDRSVIRGLGIVFVAVVFIAGLMLMPGGKSEKVTQANLDPWMLMSRDPNAQYGTYLANGLISTRIMGDGVGCQDSRPLPCFMAGLYDEEKLIPMPTWSNFRILNGASAFKIDKSADYKQTLNMKTGILTTEATWRNGDKTLTGQIEVVVSRAQPNVGLIRAVLVPNFTGMVNIDHSVYNTSSQLEEIEKPDKAVGVYRTKQSGIVLALALNPDVFSSVSVKRDKKAILSYYTAIAIGKTPDLARQFAVSELNKAVANSAKFIDDHKAAWAKLWAKDIIIDGPKKDQQAIHSCMFYLLQSVREGSEWSIPPMGLSDNAFSGHVFWDADVWMFPALILQHPELARSIVDYRYNTLPGAMANAKTSGYKGAEYAWESGYTGKEDTPPGLVYRNERHINGDVALAQWQYYLATGDINWLKTRGYPVIKATADYWVSRVTWAPDKNRYEILKVVPPDENADLVNNSVYTNAIAKMNLDIANWAAKLAGNAPNPEWQKVALKMYIPFDAKNNRFTAFDEYKGREAKQADSELLIYPLQYKYGSQSMTDIYKNTFGLYAPKVMPNGPAMSSSAHAVIAARLGDSKKSYSDFRKSYEPFLRGPFNYFNEKRSTTYENMCFLTGAAGPVGSALFGLAGISMDYSPENSAKLKYTPCLPKEWKSVKITGIQWRGREFNLSVSSAKATETQ